MVRQPVASESLWSWAFEEPPDNDKELKPFSSPPVCGIIDKDALQVFDDLLHVVARLAGPHRTTDGGRGGDVHPNSTKRPAGMT